MDFEEIDDPDLRAAIAASLEDLQGPPSNSNSLSNGRQQDIVDLTADSDDDELVPLNTKSKPTISSETDEEEDEELKRALELSKQEEMEDENAATEPEVVLEQNHNDEEAKTQNPPSAQEIKAPAPGDEAAQSSLGILGLNRKQMEQERLARIAKRKAEENISPPPTHGAKLLKVEATTEGNLGTKDTSTKTPYDSTSSQAKLPGAGQTDKMQQTTTPSTMSGVQFPEGVVKKTWAFGCCRMGDDIKIEEVFQRSDLELAVLSSFMWDMEWVFSKLDTKGTRFILVMQAKEESTKRQYEMETEEMANLRLCFPPMDGQVNCMHSKLMLLFHPTYLRIAIPSANLTPYDWGEKGGIMENMVFLIDLPKKADKASDGDSKTAFYEDLVYFLKATTLNETIIAKLGDFDFGQTARFAFVHTIGGSQTGEAWKRTGYCGLARAVRGLGLQSSKPLNIDFVTSSVGSLNDEFMRSIYLAAQGQDPNHLTQKSTTEEWKERFRVFFPSEATVMESKGGPRNAGTICFQPQWWNGAKFPRHVLRDCVSRRKDLLMHNKILFARPEEPIALSDQSRCPAWAYLGSANLSESAWGRLVNDRATKKPKLNCRNWECGVLVPIIETVSESTAPTDRRRDNSQNSPASSDFADVFKETVPVPMQVPGRSYGPNMKPWFSRQTF